MSIKRSTFVQTLLIGTLACMLAPMPSPVRSQETEAPAPTFRERLKQL